MIGRTISHYKIFEKLGEGGMGVVYKAHDTKLDRLVALKFLPHHLETNDDDKARFLQEAKAASAVTHPNVCVIHDITEDNDQQFIVMEYVEGKTLRHLLPFPKIQDAITFAIQIGEALQEAHSKGIVHRDIKSDNIMVTPKNQIKVMDFGLAKLKGSLKLTKTSSTVGTLAYMAPEQIQGGEVDARSDIFSFGVVLYELLTGHLPFRGEHEAAMVYSIVNEEAEPIQKFLPDISSELVHVINRALEKDPEDRYQTVHDMVIDLRRLKKETTRVSRIMPTIRPSEGSIEAAEQPTAGLLRRPKRKIMLIGVGGIAALIVVFIYFFFLTQRSVRLNPDMTIRTLEIPFTEVNYAGLSRDGNWVAFGARDAKKEWSMYFMNIAKGDPRRLTTDQYRSVGYGEVSPDGSEVLYVATPPGRPLGIYLISSLGGTARKIAEPADCGRWRPDGQLVGYIRTGGNVSTQPGERGFWTTKPDGSENRCVFVDSLCYVGGISSWGFDWSPDGTSIAWLRSFPGYEEIIIHHLESKEERQITAYKKRINEIAWASNDQILFSSSKSGNTNIWMVPAKGGEAIQVTKGSGPDISVRVSADGKRLLYTEQRSINHIWTANTDGSDARQLTFDDRRILFLSFSPDNKRISSSVFSTDLIRPGGHIFIMQADGSNRTQITTGNSWNFDAAWSPDSKWMTYGSYLISETFDSSRIYLIEVANPGTPQFIGRGYAAWWIDSRTVAIANSDVRASLYSIEKGEIFEVFPDSTWQFPLQKDKHRLIRDSRKGREGWWLEKRDAGKSVSLKQILPSEYLSSAWLTANLRYLLYLRQDKQVWRISLPDGKHERLPQIFDGLSPYYGRIQISYDNKQVVYLKGRYDSKLVLIENLFE